MTEPFNHKDQRRARMLMMMQQVSLLIDQMFVTCGDEQPPKPEALEKLTRQVSELPMVATRLFPLPGQFHRELQELARDLGLTLEVMPIQPGSKAKQ